MKDFLLPPDAARDRDADIRPNEVLTSVRVPAPPAGTRAAYHKQTERESYDWPICDVAVILATEAGERSGCHNRPRLGGAHATACLRERADAAR